MKQLAPSANDVSYVTQLLGVHYGAALSSTSLGSLRRKNPQLDRFDWLLLIVALEIDLKVRVPQRLIDANRVTIAQFARKIASMPKVTEVNHTLEMLKLLAQGMLGADDGIAPFRRLNSNKSRKRRTP